MDFGLYGVLLTGGLITIFIAVLIGGALVLFHDQSAEEQRFCWHQLVKNSFHISVIDSAGLTRTVDIHYNSKALTPKYTIKGERRIQIRLPDKMTRKEFFEFAATLQGIDESLTLIIRGINQERLLNEFKFSAEDISSYRDFKRHLLLKALRT